ncbi:MAG: oligosaccharide flippase family protein, partial [Bacteroidales bacterium]|nr:oligosaccharide flippase family protein [Bacteroidales bacterium]
MAGSSKKIFSGVSWSIITNVVNALYGFIMIPILIKYFGKAEYGLIGLAQSVNAYMRLMDMGLTSTNVRFFSNWLTKGDNEKVKKLFSTCTSIYGVVGLINAAVLIVVYFFSDSIFNVTSEQDEILKTLLLILAFSAFVNWFTSCYNQIIQATENVAWTQKRILVTKLLMVLVLVLTVTLKLNLITYFILTIGASWSVLPWVIRKIKKLTPFVSFLPSFDKSIFKEILPYTLNIFSFSI